MSGRDEQLTAVRESERTPADPMVHYQNPARPWESLCGAPVVGVRTQAPLACVVCADLMRGKRP